MLKRIDTPWLGERHGHLSDWVTQRWVEYTGQRVTLADHPWLDAATGRADGIGSSFFARYARTHGLLFESGDPSAGLLEDFGALAGPGFDPSRVDPSVADFYERTGGFDLDAWAEWCGPFRPFGRLLQLLFSRRLQQLNVPLSSLDTSRGVTSEVVRLRDPTTGSVRITAWIRHLVRTGDVLYAGTYSIARIPGHDGPCIKVAFPLPNGNALVIMRPQAHEDGSLSVTSAGRRFGDPGFYFTIVDGPGRIVARYVRSLRESIRVHPARNGEVHADHVLVLWGATFLRLHYRLRSR
ncbi:MAG TPA: hypothetical protein VMM79_13240 [Longimicrobiales bacterium]|nr:hypothetical protein [Longimicrobiales bacterium]